MHTFSCAVPHIEFWSFADSILKWMCALRFQNSVVNSWPSFETSVDFCSCPPFWRCQHWQVFKQQNTEPCSWENVVAGHSLILKACLFSLFSQPRGQLPILTCFGWATARKNVCSLFQLWSSGQTLWNTSCADSVDRELEGIARVQPSKANSYFKCDNEMLEMIVCLDLVLCTGTGMKIYKISKEQQESVCVCVYMCN